MVWSPWCSRSRCAFGRCCVLSQSGSTSPPEWPGKAGTRPFADIGQFASNARLPFRHFVGRVASNCSAMFGYFDPLAHKMASTGPPASQVEVPIFRGLGARMLCARSSRPGALALAAAGGVVESVGRIIFVKRERPPERRALEAQLVAKPGILARIWAKLGPIGMARRDECRRDTPWPPRPRVPRLPGMSEIPPKVEMSSKLESRRIRIRPLSRKRILPRFS